MDYYVYIHYRADGITPFYVGKGKGNRAYSFGKKDRSKYWHKVRDKEYTSGESPITVKLISGISDEQAKVFEKFWIGVFGRKTEKTEGLLVNLTDGGGGTSGWKMSPESRKKISIKHKGRKSTAVWSDESKMKISLSRKGHISPQRGKRYSRDEKLYMSYRSRQFDFVLISPIGETHTVRNRREFANLHGMVYSGLSMLAHGRIVRYKGWVFSHKIPKE